MEQIKRTRLIYILLALVLGGLGIHNFYAGYKKKAIIQLLCVFPGVIVVIPAIFEMIWVLVDICTVTKDADGRVFD